MGTVSAYYAHDHGEHPILLSTAADVDALIDRVRAESLDHAPILIQLYVVHDVYGQELSAGVRSDRGVLRYAGRDWFDGVYSVGRDSTGGDSILYFYMDNDTEFPPGSEVPLETVREAIKEYLTTNGARPECAEWHAR